MFEPIDENKKMAVLKSVIFWCALFFMFSFFISIFLDDTQISQSKRIIELDMENKVNICSPDDNEEFLKEESFFGF